MPRGSFLEVAHMKTRFVLAHLVSCLLLFCGIAMISPSIAVAEETKAKTTKELAEWVAKVEQKMAISNPISIVESKQLNAWTKENDKTLYVTRGLLLFCQTDDELAGVLFHELGHQSLNHFELARERQEEFRQAVERAAFFSRNSSIDNSDAVNTSAKIIATLAVPYFGHGYEYDADKFTYFRLYDKKMDPMALCGLFTRMAESRLDSQLLAFLSTHPAFISRNNRFRAYDLERVAYDKFCHACFRLKPDAYSQAVVQNSFPGYKIELLKKDKKMSYYLLLPEKSGLSYKRGTLEIVPGSHIIILAKKTSDALWVEVGMNIANLKAYSRNGDDVDDFVMMIDSSAFTPNMKEIVIYCDWREKLKNGFRYETDEMKIKLSWPKNTVAVVNAAADNEQKGNIIGPLDVMSPYGNIY